MSNISTLSCQRRMEVVLKVIFRVLLFVIMTCQTRGNMHCCINYMCPCCITAELTLLFIDVAFFLFRRDEIIDSREAIELVSDPLPRKDGK